jgi:hypothetical protein
MASTAARTEARRRARARLAVKAEERRKREQAELGHITDFEAASTRRGVATENRGIHAMPGYAIANLLRGHRVPTDVALGRIHALTSLTGPCQDTRALAPPASRPRRAAARTPCGGGGRRQRVAGLSPVELRSWPVGKFSMHGLWSSC